MPDLLALPPKAISLWQPWATLIVIGAKKIETRSWPMYHRGPIAIHAAKTRQEMDMAMLMPFHECLEAAGYEEPFHDIPFGCIVGYATVVDCKRTKDLQGTLTDQEHAFGNYEFGRFGWLLEDAVRIEPIPCRGMQGIWKWAPLEAEAPLPVKDEPEPVVDPQGVLL